MDVKSFIQGTLSLEKDDLWALVVYQCQWCLLVRDREKEIQTGDGQMNRTRKGGGGLWKLFRENTKTFLNVTFGMIPAGIWDLDSGLHTNTHARSIVFVPLCSAGAKSVMHTSMKKRTLPLCSKALGSDVNITEMVFFSVSSLDSVFRTY